MPRTRNNTRTADDRAHARSEAGMTRELQVTRDDDIPHPGRGGTRGYPAWYRIQMVDIYHYFGAQGIRDLPTPPGTKHASLRSIRRWDQRLDAYRMTGNKAREDLVGVDLLLLSICKFIFPNATADECTAFIWNNGGDFYSQQAVSNRIKEIKLTHKKVSTEAFQAQHPQNVLKLERFFTYPPPLGIVGVERCQLIDVDEMAISLEKTNRKYGHAHKTIRIRVNGQYVRGAKLTVCMTVEPGDSSLPANVDGSIEKPRHWIWIREAGGTSAVDFAYFCNIICTELENAPAQGSNLDDHRVFMWDNLSSHHAPIVIQTVEGRPSPNFFQIVRRPPYQPKFGPIEYVFAELGSALQKIAHRDWTQADLKINIRNVAANLGTNGRFNNTFIHCGYT